ncbi:MAG TPA: hypothetical protein VG407_08055 [Caulobacteraceae bacterium]|jgi:hypothetical protein|nr:hypothetical protein [Caulobacteraceae bacterium]
MAKDRQEEDARDDIARALGRVSADYMLRSLGLIRTATGGSLLDALICLAVVRGNLAQFLGDEAFERMYGGIDTVPPDEVRRPVTIRGLAEFLDLPYETVRRNVLRLASTGLLEKRAGGYVVPVHVARLEAWNEIIRANSINVERLVRAYQRLVELKTPQANLTIPS